jgi:hypothetical protein
MLQLRLSTARTANCRVLLQRCCAQTAASAALQNLHRALALQENESDLATILSSTLSTTSWAPTSAILPWLVA